MIALSPALCRAVLLDEAEAELRCALRLLPADPHAHFEMGLLLRRGARVPLASDSNAWTTEIEPTADGIRWSVALRVTEREA